MLHLTSCEYDPPRDRVFALSAATFIADNPTKDLTLGAKTSVDVRAVIVAALRALCGVIQPNFIDDLIARGWFVPKPPPVKRRGHAAPPGDGPGGETCGSCRHYTRWQSTPDRIRLKCAHREATWTKGAATDIRKKDPACALWKPPASLFGQL